MQKYIFAIELILLVVIAVCFMALKSKLPDIFFPPANVTVYLPPQQEDLVLKKQGKPQLQLRMIKANASTFLKMPFTTEMETTVLFALVLVFQFVIIETLKGVYQYLYSETLTDSGVILYFSLISVVLIISIPYRFKLVSMFKAATIGGLQGQETKMAFLISILCTVAILVVFFGFRDFVDINIRHEFQRQQVHLEVVFQDFMRTLWLSSLTDIFILVLSLLISFIIFCFVPVIIRFGNCWTELKNPQEELEVPNHTFVLLTFQLLLPLFIICLNLTPFTKSLPSGVPPIFLQTILLSLLCALQVLTYRIEIERHMYKGLVWAKLIVDQPDLLIPVQKKVAGLFKGMVVVAYQLFSKIAIPILFMLILIQKQQTFGGERHLDYPAAYTEKDYFCVVERVPLMEYLSGASETCKYQEPNEAFIPRSLSRRMQIYGLFSRTFVYTIVQFFFFNYMFLMFFLKIFYIFFVNKTQTVASPYKMQTETPEKPKEEVKDEKKAQKKKKRI